MSNSDTRHPISDIRLKVVFMGTPDFAVPALQGLIDSQHEVICVYTRPPRPKGRGHRMQKTPVHKLAEAYDIEVRTPDNLGKDEQAIQDFKALDADIGIVAAYGLILPKSVLEAPRHGFLNIHASLLPRWRGAAPIQHAIWTGDHESGVTIMQMETGLDTGKMLNWTHTPISPATTAADLHDTLAEMGARLIVNTLDGLASGAEPVPVPQDESRATYAPMLNRADGRIDWHNTAEAIERQYRALTPWPGVWTTYNDNAPLKIKALTLSSHDPGAAQPGTLLDKQGTVACGTGCVRLEQVQPGNARPMDIAGAINGGYFHVGNVFV